MTAAAWNDLPKHFPGLLLDAFVVMPNHVHGILFLTPTASGAPPRHRLGEIVRAFKAYSARRINARRNTPGCSVWQRNYHERIVRDEEELARIRRYIAENPAAWPSDPENPMPTVPVE